MYHKYTPVDYQVSNTTFCCPLSISTETRSKTPSPQNNRTDFISTFQVQERDAAADLFEQCREGEFKFVKVVNNIES